MEGKNSFSNNASAGLKIGASAAAATVSVDASAEVAVNNNGEVGILVEATDVSFELNRKRSRLEACYNNVNDWDTTGSATFAGSRYICDNISGDGPNCRPCSRQRDCKE